MSVASVRVWVVAEKAACPHQRAIVQARVRTGQLRQLLRPAQSRDSVSQQGVANQGGQRSVRTLAPSRLLERTGIPHEEKQGLAVMTAHAAPLIWRAAQVLTQCRLQWRRQHDTGRNAERSRYQGHTRPLQTINRSTMN